MVVGLGGVDDVVGICVVVGGWEVDGGGGGGGADEDCLGGSLLPPDPSKATIWAELPLATVTTQNEEPPAPTAASLLATLPSAADGSIWQGRPEQPPPGHSIFTPNPGFVPLRPDDSQIGFHPIFTKVWPLLSVLAPAT